MAYAILHTIKLKAYKEILFSAIFNFREDIFINFHINIEYTNKIIGAKTSKEIVRQTKQRLKTVVKIRKNAVLAIQYIISASNFWLTKTSQIKIEAYFNASYEWLIYKHGKDNIIACIYHFDKINPYICAYVIPIDEKGKLNCSFFLDGKQKLIQLQTDFAQQVGQKFGLKRGKQKIKPNL